MVGSGCVISTHNTEIDMAMSTCRVLLAYSRLSPAQAIYGRQPFMLAKSMW